LAEEIDTEIGHLHHLDLTLGLTGIPSCITHQPLSTYEIFLKLDKLSADVRTDVENGFIRLIQTSQFKST